MSRTAAQLATSSLDAAWLGFRVRARARVRVRVRYRARVKVRVRVRGEGWRAHQSRKVARDFSGKFSTRILTSSSVRTWSR